MSRKKFSNSRTNSFIATIPVISMENSGIVERCKFNFSFLDLSKPEALKDELSIEFFNELFEKLKHYSTQPISYWTTEAAGRGNGTMLEIYKTFPKRSDFVHPTSVPHEAVWGRFRMDRTVRLAGFFVPNELNHKLCKKEKYRFCTNTFYVVYVDLHHRFYVTK
ncbi:hypothetical protein SAMN04490189_4456 [Pseudomonas koreensis]|nr:hypothetical protein SAMN04490189_4456 [Pseudomonas koreensis]